MRRHSGSGSVWSSASVLSFKQARKQVKLTFHPRVCLSASQLVGATVKLPLCLQLVFFQLKHWGNCLFCSFIYVLEWQYCIFTIKEGLLPHKSHTRHSINKCIGHFHPSIHTYIYCFTFLPRVRGKAWCLFYICTLYMKLPQLMVSLAQNEYWKRRETAGLALLKAPLKLAN